MNKDIAQLLGTLLIIAFSITLFLIAYTKRCPQMMREAVIAAGGYLLVASTVRLMVQAAMISQQDGRVLNGLLVVPFLGALLIPWIARKLVKHAP